MLVRPPSAHSSTWWTSGPSHAWQEQTRIVESRHISIWINRPAGEVYRYAADPRHLPDWASGLAQGDVTQVGAIWVANSPMGEVAIEFTPANDFGILDHVVTVPGGEPVFNPLRVVPAGPEWCEVVFTLRRRAMGAAEYESDAKAVVADLASLKGIMESAN